jgi:hypothetical protein
VGNDFFYGRSFWDEVDIVAVDLKTLANVSSMLAGCEACSQDADLPLFWVFDRIIDRNSAPTDYIMEEPIRCEFCGGQITEKTLVDLIEI